MKSNEYIETLFTCALAGCSGNAQAVLALRELRDSAIASTTLVEQLTRNVAEALMQVYLQTPTRNMDLFVINGGKK